MEPKKLLLGIRERLARRRRQPARRTRSPDLRVVAIRFGLGILVLITVALLGATILGERGVIRHDRLRREIEDVTRLNNALRAENERLRLETRGLRGDPGYIEHVVRDELGWVAKDELVLIFEGDGDSP